MQKRLWIVISLVLCLVVSSCSPSTLAPAKILNNETSTSTSSQTNTTYSDPDEAERRTQALNAVEDFLGQQGYEVVDAKKSIDQLVFSVNIPGISDADDLSTAPDNWEDTKESLVSSNEEAIQLISNLYDGTIVIYLKDLSGNILLTCLNSKTSYDKFKAESQDSNSASSGSSERYVWVTSSGKKYHYISDCSGMKNPTKISISSAQSQGYTACKNCA